MKVSCTNPISWKLRFELATVRQEVIPTFVTDTFSSLSRLLLPDVPTTLNLINPICVFTEGGPALAVMPVGTTTLTTHQRV